MKATDIGFILLAVILCSLVLVIPVSAVKTAEQSLDDTLTRGGSVHSYYHRFTQHALLRVAATDFFYDRETL